MGCKSLFLTVSALLFVNFCLVSAPAEEEDATSMEMLKKLYQFEKINKRNSETGTVGDVRNGILNVKAVNLKQIRPQDVYYQGEVETPETMVVQFSKGGKVVSIIGEGEYVLNPIYDDKKNLVREGNSIAVLDKEEIAIRLKNAKATRQIIDMSQDYVNKMTSAQEKLAAQNYITSFALETARISLMSSLIEYEAKSRDIDYVIANYQDNLVKSPFSGLVVEVYAGDGDKVEEGAQAIKILKMDTVKVKIPFDVDLVNLEPKRHIAYIFPNGLNVTVAAMLDSYQNDKDNIYAYVPNEIIDSNRLTSEQKNLPKVFEVYSVSDLENRNIESFYLPNFKPKKAPLLFLPLDSIRQDAKGSYIFKIKNLNLTTGMEKIPRLYTIEKIYVDLGDVFSSLYYPYSVDHSKMSRSVSAVEGKRLIKGDIVVGKDDGKLEDDKEVIIINPVWKFYPGQTVRVLIPTLTKFGIWIPRKALIHNDINLNYVYLVKGGLAKLTRVNVVGEYEGYCLINGEGIEAGAQVVLITKPEMMQLIYDGMKIRVLETQEAPEFLAHDHVTENLFQAKESSKISNKNSGKSSSVSSVISKLKSAIK